MAGSVWAIDLGTTHTRVARWDRAEDRPLLCSLPTIAAETRSAGPAEVKGLIPSAIEVIDRRLLRDRIGRWFDRQFFIGRQGWIGRPALERNRAVHRSGFASGFKLGLMHGEALRPLVTVGRETHTVRDIARTFLRELVAEVQREHGERIRAATFTVPVEAFETYRAEIAGLARRLGIQRVRFIDEPVAAALGYGISVADPRLALVVDFGGGTLHTVVVALSSQGLEGGSGRVLAKSGRAVGGSLVDDWVMQACLARAGLPPISKPRDDEEAFWRRQLLYEARLAKEEVYFQPETVYHLPVLGPYQVRPTSADAASSAVPWSRDDLEQLLRERGVYDMIEGCLSDLDRQCRGEGIALGDVTDVLMTGGSALLPGIYPMLEQRFGRDRVRAWQPMDAVALGACAFAAERVTQADFIVHDYAFVTHDPKTHEREYTVIVPRGTRIPTKPDFWRRQLVPTCALGEPERTFRLVVCEIGRRNGGGPELMWDAGGNLHRLGGEGDDRLVVPLNESDPALGFLEPPHSPRDRQPRLEITFAVDTDRWLSATVLDLRTRRYLMREEPVVRLL